MPMFAKIVLDSVSPDGIRLTTMHLRYPRMIHSELMTHRVLSRNARSSRAVPVRTMLDEVRNDPFVPWHWGKNQKGMQAGEECNAFITLPDVANFDHGLDWTTNDHSREDAWLLARDHAVTSAEAFMEAGYHKQIANRLLEPFVWIDTLVSSTDWANFFALRDHPDAEPHLQDLARMMKQAMEASTPGALKPNQWHLPYVTENDRDYACFDMGLGANTLEYWDVLIKLSVARCARISYKPFDGDASIEREFQRYEQLVGSAPIHASPAEHQARPDRHSNREVTMAKFGGWEPNDWMKRELHGNFRGWIQFRKTLPNEAAKELSHD